MRANGDGAARGAAREAAVIDLLEERARAVGNGRGSGNGGGGNGRGGNGGGGGEGGGDDGGPDIGPFGRLLLSSLRQMAELQMHTTESTLEGVAEVAVRLADQAARGDEAVAKELGERLMRSLSANADLAEKTASAIERLAGRVAALEHQLAAQRPNAGASADEGATGP